MIAYSHSLLVAQEHVAHSFALQMFMLSSALLLIGICTKVWFHAFKLAWVDSITIDKIEADHPYIPDMLVIRRVAIAALILLLAGAFLVTKYEPFTGTYEFLYLVGSFIIVATLAILSELHWQQYKEYAFAVLAASSVSFIVFLLRQFIENEDAPATLFFSGSLLISTVISWQLLHHIKKQAVNVVFLLVMIFWCGLHLSFNLR